MANFPHPNPFKLQVAELANRFGEPSYEGIAQCRGVTYQQVKKWHEEYLAGTLQRQVEMEEFCERKLKRIRPRLIILKVRDSERSPRFTEKPH